MAQKIEEIRKEIAELSVGAKNELLRELIADLGGKPDQEVEKAWIAECERRLEQLRSGAVESVPSELVFESARKMLQG